jgi:hypothetical protein
MWYRGILGELVVEVLDEVCKGYSQDPYFTSKDNTYCPTCQRTKQPRQKTFGLLVPVQTLKRKRNSIGIDFTTHLRITTKML